MTKIMLIISASFFIITTWFTIIIFGNESNRISLFIRHGFIEHGSRFGISVGQKYERLPSVLPNSHLNLVGIQHGGYCYHHNYPDNEIVSVYYDQSWRKMTVCIGEKAGRVASLQWDASSFQPRL